MLTVSPLVQVEEMTTVFKLTDHRGRTRGGITWGEAIEHTAPGQGEIIGPGWLHAYPDPLLAVLMNPVYGNFADPLLWQAEGHVGGTHYGLVLGCTRLWSVCEVPVPRVSTSQRVAFGMLTAIHVCLLNPITERVEDEDEEGEPFVYDRYWPESAAAWLGDRRSALAGAEEDAFQYLEAWRIRLSQHNDSLQCCTLQTREAAEQAQRAATIAHQHAAEAIQQADIANININGDEDEHGIDEDDTIGANDAAWAAAMAAQYAARAAALSSGLVTFDPVFLARLACVI